MLFFLEREIQVPNNYLFKKKKAAVYCFMLYLIHLVCSAVLSNSDGYCGFVWHGYPQLHVGDSVIVLTERQKGRERHK